MTSEDLQRKNASLRDKMEEVLEMHPELRDVTEAIALRQDLHVQVGTPFLERTQDKLRDRARAIIERRPELEYYFEDLIPKKVDKSGEPKLKAALEANVVQASGALGFLEKPFAGRTMIELVRQALATQSC